MSARACAAVTGDASLRLGPESHARPTGVCFQKAIIYTGHHHVKLRALISHMPV